MKISHTGLAVAAALSGAFVLLSLPAAAPATPSEAAGAEFYSPPRELVHYGHVESLVRRGGRFVLRFDPALWLGGETASRAAVQDGVIQPGEAVPNDYYIRDESHRLLTFLVPPTARATVLVQGPTSIRSQQVGVVELAQIVKGGNPRNRRLYDRRNGLGFWILVRLDTVRSLDQQYQP